MNLPDDVVRLVIAARKVAFGDARGMVAPLDSCRADFDELDAASEAFASRVPWEDEPDTRPAQPQPVGREASEAMVEALTRALDMLDRANRSTDRPSDYVARFVSNTRSTLAALSGPAGADAGEALDTIQLLRADLAEEDAELHAQRIAVLDDLIIRLSASTDRYGTLRAERDRLLDECQRQHEALERATLIMNKARRALLRGTDPHEAVREIDALSPDTARESGGGR